MDEHEQRLSIRSCLESVLDEELIRSCFLSTFVDKKLGSYRHLVYCSMFIMSLENNQIKAQEVIESIISKIGFEVRVVPHKYEKYIVVVVYPKPKYDVEIDFIKNEDQIHEIYQFMGTEQEFIKMTEEDKAASIKGRLQFILNEKLVKTATLVTLPDPKKQRYMVNVSMFLCSLDKVCEEKVMALEEINFLARELPFDIRLELFEIEDVLLAVYFAAHDFACKIDFNKDVTLIKSCFSHFKK